MTNFFLLSLVAVASAGNLYGVTQDPKDGAIYLETIDPDTGKQTPLGSGVPNFGLAQELSTFDATNKIFYQFGYNDSDDKATVLGFNCANGSVAIHEPIPFLEELFVGVGQAVDWDPVSGDLIFMGRSSTTKKFRFVRYKPNGGYYKAIGESFDGIDVLGATSAFSPEQRLEFVQVGRNLHDPVIDIVWINIDSEEMGTIAMDPSTDHVLASLDYDMQSDRLYGLGVEQNSTGAYVQTLNYLDLHTLKFGIAGEISGFLGTFGGETAIDATRRTLSAIMSTPGANVTTDPFYIVGVDLDKGSVASSAKLGYLLPPKSTEDPLPWSIQTDDQHV